MNSVQQAAHNQALKLFKDGMNLTDVKYKVWFDNMLHLNTEPAAKIVDGAYQVYKEQQERTTTVVDISAPVQPSNNLQEIPQQLKDLPNWVQWRIEEKNGRSTKVPYISGTLTHASSTDSKTWSTFETAVTNQTLSSSQGIGFVIHGLAVEADLVGFDVDGSRDVKTGKLTDWAEELLTELDSYAEITPSGTG